MPIYRIESGARRDGCLAGRVSRVQRALPYREGPWSADYAAFDLSGACRYLGRAGLRIWQVV